MIAATEVANRRNRNPPHRACVTRPPCAGLADLQIVLQSGCTSLGRTDRGENTARSISQFWQARALGSVVESLVEAGDLDSAENIARSITGPAVQGRVLPIIFAEIDINRSRGLLATVLVSTSP